MKKKHRKNIYLTDKIAPEVSRMWAILSYSKNIIYLLYNITDKVYSFYFLVIPT